MVETDKMFNTLTLRRTISGSMYARLMSGGSSSNGELTMAASPNTAHQIITGNLFGTSSPL